MNFQLLENYIKALPSFSIPGASCIVYQDHKPVFVQSAGFIDGEKQKKTSENSLFYMYSVSKVVTAVAVLQLVEKGKLSLDDELCRYLPAFENMTVKTEDGSVVPAKDKITIFQLLTMTSGVSYEIYTDEVKALIDSGEATTRNVVNAIAGIPLSYQPGTRYVYGFGFDILGAVVEAVTDMPFASYVKSNIFTPLGMSTAAYTKADINSQELSDYFAFDPLLLREKRIEKDLDARVCSPFVSGGAGMICSAKDIVLFADALACGGVGQNGTRILSADSVERMKKNYLNSQQLADVHNGVLAPGYGYGFGVRTLLDRKQVPTLAADGEFGWGGACGTFILSDTANKLSIAFAMQVVPHIEFTYLTHPHNLIRDLTYRCFAE